MKLVRLGNPHYEVRRNLVDELFDSFLYNDYHAEHKSVQPATNVYETEKEFKLELMLPGFKKEEINLDVLKNLLTIKVEKENKKKSKGDDNYLHREFGFNNFEKQFNIPETVEAEKINASYENGVLEVILPKKEKEAEKAPLKISIS